MTLNTSLKGRLRNTNLPKSHALFPLFEVVVNSIHSIDKRIKIDQEFEISKANIKVRVIQSAQKTLDDSKLDITGFEIVDNGIGYNSQNYDSIQNLDSEYKIDQIITELQICWSYLKNKIVKHIKILTEKSPEILKPILESQK